MRRPTSSDAVSDEVEKSRARANCTFPRDCRCGDTRSGLLSIDRGGLLRSGDECRIGVYAWLRLGLTAMSDTREIIGVLVRRSPLMGLEPLQSRAFLYADIKFSGVYDLPVLVRVR